MDHHPTPSPPTIIWTRRAEHREADSATLRGMRGTIVYCPALHITDAAAEAEQVPVQPSTLIVTSAEAAKRLVALAANPSVPWKVLTFSPLVAGSLANDKRFTVTLFAEANSGEELAACILKNPAKHLPSDGPCFFAGAAEPAFNFASYLTAEGWLCRHWPLYRTSIISTPSPELAKSAASFSAGDGKQQPTIAVFCSPSAVRGFAAQWQSLISAPPHFGPDSSWLALVIGKTTASAATPYFARVEVAAEPRLASIAARLHQLAGSSPPVTM